MSVYDANFRFNTRPDYCGKITLNSGGVGVSGVFSYPISPSYTCPSETHLYSVLTSAIPSGHRNYYK